MEKEAKIYVAGHTGLVGSAVIRRLQQEGYTNLILRTHQELDLTDRLATEEFFQTERPDYVFVAAAKVGGIMANSRQPADFGQINTRIALNTIDSAYHSGVKKLLYFSSNCAYPKMAPQPMKEEYLLMGLPEKTNEAYSLAKILGIRMCEYYNIQYGTDFISCMPANAYGPGDNYDPNDSHVIPAFIRKFHEAKENNDTEVVMWGTGDPVREFIYIDDIASGAVFLMNHYSGNETVNIGTGKEYAIKDLADIIRDVVGYEGKVTRDLSKPDGTPRKLMDSSKIFELGWKPEVDFDEGIRNTYQDFLVHKDDYLMN